MHTRDQPLVMPIPYMFPQNTFSLHNYLQGNYPHIQLCMTVTRKILNIYLHLLALNATVARMYVYLIIVVTRCWMYRAIHCSLGFCVRLEMFILVCVPDPLTLSAGRCLCVPWSRVGAESHTSMSTSMCLFVQSRPSTSALLLTLSPGSFCSVGLPSD